MSCEYDFIEVWSWGSNQHKVTIASGNGLVPDWHQAITWNNDDQDVRHPMTSLGHNELINADQ